jgi:hypothetical protein
MKIVKIQFYDGITCNAILYQVPVILLGRGYDHTLNSCPQGPPKKVDGGTDGHVLKCDTL